MERTKLFNQNTLNNGNYKVMIRLKPTETENDIISGSTQ